MKIWPLLSAGEQTRGSWAREIESYDQVPEVYTGFFQDLTHDNSLFPYTVVTPTYKGFLKRENEKLICNPDHKIHILENDNNQVLRTCYALEDIDYIEVGTVLLRSWLRLYGRSVEGEPSSATLTFNSVTEYMFKPFVEMVRPATADRPDTLFGSASDKFDYLEDLNFKLMNYARRALLPGERVTNSVFQPEIRSRVSRLLGPVLTRTVSPAHLTILTEKELILIRDTGGRKRGQDTRYGGTWFYVPLDRIRYASIEERENDTLVLSVDLLANNHIEVLFTASKRQEISQLQRQTEAMIPGKVAPPSPRPSTEPVYAHRTQHPC